MVAEEVVLDNLHKILNNNENESLLDSVNLLVQLRESVKSAANFFKALENGDGIRGRSKIVALVYKVDDLIDKFLTFNNSTTFDNQATQQNADTRLALVNASSRAVHEVSLFFSSRNQLVLRFVLAYKLKKTSQRIIDLANQLLNNQNADYKSPPIVKFPSFVKLAENKVIGRDRDRDNIIEEMLRQPKKESRTDNVSILPIVGSPGVGKTALAKFVFNTERVKSHFDLRMWIQVSHISDEHDDAEIVREIVESFTKKNSRLGNNIPRSGARQNGGLPLGDLMMCSTSTVGTSATPPTNCSRRDEISINERRLQKEIEGKLYLLVLDGASLKQWKHLKSLLESGARGSQVLVTTRSNTVADSSKSENVKLQPLKGLSKQDSYLLFRKFAFGQVNDRECTLKQVGYSIAENCGGIPLTIKVAASLLYMKSNNNWKSFKEELMRHEENTMDHVLNISYADLPNRLKACFSYCSLFPNDFTYNKHDLISLWIAQGFTQWKPGQSLEEAAEKDFRELCRRCFFEDVSTDALENIVTCKMHPIMHKLACRHAGGVIANMYGLNSGVNNRPLLDNQVLEPTCCKHISVSCQRAPSTNIAPALLKAQSLRTLLLVTEAERHTKLDMLVCNVLVSNFKCLRVLDLNDLGIEEIPLSLGELVHLRFLDLSKNDGLVALPKSITKLYNLQTLKLNTCPKLRRLPCNFRELVSLTRLEVDECDSLTCMPLGLEKLTQLETLSRFVVGKDCSKDKASIGLKALKDLKNLRGRLSIEFTGDWATNIMEAPSAELSHKTSLKELKISWEKSVSERSDCHQLLQVLEDLQPNVGLKSLHIEGYKGEYFPSWANMHMLTYLPNLVVVSIEGCDKCEYLPPFGELQNLTRLTLRHMANVRYVERELAGDNQGNEKFFPSLKELILHNFYKLEGWQSEVMGARGGRNIRKFPFLTKLRIWNCPNLGSMPLFMEVEDLDLRNVNQMLLEECSKKAFKVGKSNSKILKLHINGCHDLKSFKAVREGLGGLSSLKQLVVERCDALCSLASELKDIGSLNRLEISSCKELNLSDDGISATGSSSTKSWSSSITVNPFNGLSRNPWKSLECLHHLTLREIPKMETLPQGLSHVKSLKSLWISTCPSLKALPKWINRLTALQHLRIESCHSLTKLPAELQEVTSLAKLEITECPKLMERCRPHTGEDWHKIKHARVSLHKTWRYGLMSELEASQNTSNVQAQTDVKYIIVPVVAAEPSD